jgi:hypothetical protein
LTVAGEPLDPVLGLQDGRMQDTVAQVYALLFGAGLVLAPAYLVSAAAVAWLVWRRQGIGGSFSSSRASSLPSG